MLSDNDLSAAVPMSGCAVELNVVRTGTTRVAHLGGCGIHLLPTPALCGDCLRGCTVGSGLVRVETPVGRDSLAAASFWVRRINGGGEHQSFMSRTQQSSCS